MPDPSRFSLGDFRLRIDPLLLPQLTFPEPYVQRGFLEAVTATPPAEDGSITLVPGLNIPKGVLAGLASFLSGYASNAPVQFLDGIRLSTDHLNKGFSITGLNWQVPSGISVLLDPERKLVGFRLEGRW